MSDLHPKPCNCEFHKGFYFAQTVVEVVAHMKSSIGSQAIWVIKLEEALKKYDK